MDCLVIGRVGLFILPWWLLPLPAFLFFSVNIKSWPGRWLFIHQWICLSFFHGGVGGTVGHTARDRWLIHTGWWLFPWLTCSNGLCRGTNGKLPDSPSLFFFLSDWTNSKYVNIGRDQSILLIWLEKHIGIHLCPSDPGLVSTTCWKLLITRKQNRGYMRYCRKRIPPINGMSRDQYRSHPRHACFQISLTVTFQILWSQAGSCRHKMWIREQKSWTVWSF